MLKFWSVFDKGGEYLKSVSGYWSMRSFLSGEAATIHSTILYILTSWTSYYHPLEITQTDHGDPAPALSLLNSRSKLALSKRSLHS
jgi:hypothetical protein